jgi:CheY-like chemotaxis protein
MPNPEQVDIVMVEDNPNDAELALRELRKRKLANTIIHLKDGQEALDWMFRTGPYAGRPADQFPKLVLLDLKLPKIDGLQVLQALRADERTRSIPVVMMTSSREESDVARSYKLGVNSFIVKPIDFDTFSAAVAEVGHYWLLLNQRAV